MIKRTKRFICYLSMVLVMTLCAGLLTACNEEPAELVSNMIHLEFTTVEYDGTEKTPAIQVVIDEETIDSKEYDVSYLNNKDAGLAVVKVTAKENSRAIKGSVSVGFEISQAEAATSTLNGINAAIENDNYKGVKITAAFTIAEGKTLTIPEGFVVDFGNNVLTNQGKIVNNGTIIQNKNIVGDGIIENNGEIRAEVSNFADLENAFSFANVVKVMADIESTNVVAENKLFICDSALYDEITIDLNGHTVKRQFRLDSAFGSKTIVITNTSENEAIINTRGLEELPAIFLKGNVANESQKFTVKLSNIKVIGDDIGKGASKWAALSSNGTYSGEHYKFSAKDCVFEGGTTAGVYLPAKYSYKFENCTISGYTGYYAKSGNHTLINCTVNGTGETYNAPSYNGNGADETGSGLVLDSAQSYLEPLCVTINGGSYSSVKGYAIEEFATSSSGAPNFYSNLEIEGSPSYSFGDGKDALYVPGFTETSVSVNAQEVVDALFEKVYENSGKLGSSTVYTYAQIAELVENLKYYVELGEVHNIGSVEQLTIGDTEFLKNQEVNVSIGNNNFIKDKAFYVEDGKLYVAAMLALFEFQGENTIKLNGKEFTVNLSTATRHVGVTELSYGGEGNSATAVDGAFNEYDLLITSASGKSYLEVYYTTAEATDKIVTRKSVNGTINYGLTDVEKTEGNPFGFFVVGYYKNFEDVPRTYDGAEMEYSFYVIGKGVASLILNIDLADVA